MRTVTLPATHSKVGSLHKVHTLGFQRSSPTGAADARSRLSHAIRRQLRYCWGRTYRWAADGTTFVLYYCDGWQYDIVGTSHALRGAPCTCTVPTHGDTCGNTDNGSYNEALEAMEQHVATYADTRDCGWKVGAA